MISAAIIFAVCGLATEPAPKPETTPEEVSTPIPLEDTEPDPWIGDDEPLLAGPRLVEDEERTLVRFEFNGNLRRLDRTPEEAALDALNLEGTARDRVDVILAVRRTQLDESVRGDFDWFLLLQAARQAGLKPDAPVKVESLAERLDTICGSRRLRDDLAAALPDEERRDFQRLIDEYWRALTLDELQLAQGRKEKLTLAQARVRAVLSQVGNELRRAFERQCKAGAGSLTELSNDLATLGEIDAKIAGPIHEVDERVKGRPSPRDCHDLTLRVVSTLSADQRRVWIQALLGVSPVLDASNP